MADHDSDSVARAPSIGWSIDQRSGPDHGSVYNPSLAESAPLQYSQQYAPSIDVSSSQQRYEEEEGVSVKK